MLFVSLAGPATNFSLMAVAALVARGALIEGVHGYVFLADLPPFAAFAFAFATVNLFLGLFNLLPIPPLDGSALLERGAAGAGYLETWHRIRPYGMLVLFLLVFSTHIFERILDPFYDRLLKFVGG